MNIPLSTPSLTASVRPLGGELGSLQARAGTPSSFPSWAA